MKPRSRHVFMVAGEPSGDELGGKLMAALNKLSAAPLVFSGVGGDAMKAQGLHSLFPLSDVAVMGPLAILKRLPKLVRRVYQTVDAAVNAAPDAVVIIDSPEFTHPIARRIRRREPGIPIVDYVSPSVWAWRSGRARKMRPYVDHVLALLPFEPEAHRRLGGPPCSYVGHPLVERYDWIKGLRSAELAVRLGLDPARPVVVVLPGSRPTEVQRLMGPFGAALQRVIASSGPLEVIIPAVPHVRGLIEEALSDWPVRPRLVTGEEDKFKAFGLAQAALAASGTVTLELGLAGVPMVVAYRVDAVAARLRFLVKVPSVVLANLVLGENAFPEFIQEDCTPDKLAAALGQLLGDTECRQRQLAALRQIKERLLLKDGTPSERAASLVLGILEGGYRRAIKLGA